MGDHAINMLDEPATGADRRMTTLDELFAAHQRRVFLVSYRVTGDVQDAEDIMQSVFMRVLKRPELLAECDNPAAYLCRVAINASIDLLRFRVRAPSETLIEELVESEVGAADAEARQAELRECLRAALLQLEPHTAEVFALRYFEELGNAEIAVLLDTSPNSVAVTLHRARARLQEILGDFDGDDQ